MVPWIYTSVYYIPWVIRGLWLVDSFSKRYTKHLTNFRFQGPYCKLMHLVFTTSIRGPRASHLGHKLKWKQLTVRPSNTVNKKHIFLYMPYFSFIYLFFYLSSQAHHEMIISDFKFFKLIQDGDQSVPSYFWAGELRSHSIWAPLSGWRWRKTFFLFQHLRREILPLQCWLLRAT